MNYIECRVCEEQLPATKEYFHRNKKSKYGLHTQCKKCRKIIESKRYYENQDKNKIKNQNYYKKNKDTILNQIKNYTLQNKEKIKRTKQKYYLSHREEKIKKVSEYQKNNRDKKNKYRKQREKNDILFKLSNTYRGRIRGILKQKKTKKSIEYLGIDIESYKEYLEKLFTENMTWDNYGFYGWHIDHIIPLSSAQTHEELISLLHYTNTQPLWAKDNFSKGSKL